MHQVRHRTVQYLVETSHLHRKVSSSARAHSPSAVLQSHPSDEATVASWPIIVIVFSPGAGDAPADPAVTGERVQPLNAGKPFRLLTPSSSTPQHTIALHTRRNLKVRIRQNTHFALRTRPDHPVPPTCESVFSLALHHPAASTVQTGLCKDCGACRGNTIVHTLWQSIFERSLKVQQLEGRYPCTLPYPLGRPSSCPANPHRLRADRARFRSMCPTSMISKMLWGRVHMASFGVYPESLEIPVMRLTLHQLCPPQAFGTEGRHQEDHAV